MAKKPRVIRRLADLNQIARRYDVPGLSDPDSPEFIAKVATRLARFRAIVDQHPEQTISEIYDGQESAAIETGLRDQLFMDIRAKFHSQSAAIKMVGSAHLGFSLTEKINKPRYRQFATGSDFDIAIVDSALFDRVWHEVFESVQNTEGWRRQQEYETFVYRGWIRPDFLPAGHPLRTEWFEGLAEIGANRIAAKHPLRVGVYKSERFLRAYQTLAIRSCQAQGQNP